MTRSAKAMSRAVAHHPPYFELISEAILTLKDGKGSSQQAIAKFIEDKYGAVLPPNFRKVLSVQLRKLAKSEKLSKIKSSYKVSPGLRRLSSRAKEPKGKSLMKGEKRGQKTKRLSEVKTPEALKGAKKEMPEKGRKLKWLSQIRTLGSPKKINQKKKKNLMTGNMKN